MIAVPVAYAAHAAGASTEMRFACAKKGSGQMRYVARAGDCRTSSERLIRFRDGRVIGDTKQTPADAARELADMPLEAAA